MNKEEKGKEDLIELIDNWFEGRGNMEKWEWNDLKKSVLKQIKSK